MVYRTIEIASIKPPVIQSDENNNIKNASKTSTHNGMTIAKSGGEKSKMAHFGKKIASAIGMKWQHVKNLSKEVNIQGNPLYSASVKATPATLAQPKIEAAPAAIENSAPSQAAVAETLPVAAVHTESSANAAAPAPLAQSRIQDMALEVATKPLPGATAHQADNEAPAPVESTPESVAAPYVKSELNAPAYKEFQKRDNNAREALRLNHDGLFLAAVNQPVAEGRYPEQLQRLDKDYDTAYAPAFAEQYAAARQKGRPEAAALKFAGAMAANSVFIEFLASADPARNAYAKVMEKFERTVIDTTSLTGKTFTTITYELAAEPLAQESKPAAPQPLQTQILKEAPTLMFSTAEKTNTAEPAIATPLKRRPIVDPNVTVTIPTILPTDHVTLRAMGRMPVTAMANAPAKPPRLAAEPAGNEDNAMQPKSDSHAAAMNSPAAPASAPIEKNSRDARSWRSMVTSSTRPSLRSFFNRLRGEKSSAFNSERSDLAYEITEKDAKKAADNVTFINNLPVLNKHP